MQRSKALLPSQVSPDDPWRHVSDVWFCGHGVRLFPRAQSYLNPPLSLYTGTSSSGACFTWNSTLFCPMPEHCNRRWNLRVDWRRCRAECFMETLAGVHRPGLSGELCSALKDTFATRSNPSRRARTDDGVTKTPLATQAQ